VEPVTSAFAAESECRELKARSQAARYRESSTFSRIRELQRSGDERSKSHGEELSEKELSRKILDIPATNCQYWENSTVAPQ
jgi:hypothetical protein